MILLFSFLLLSRAQTGSAGNQSSTRKKCEKPVTTTPKTGGPEQRAFDANQKYGAMMKCKGTGNADFSLEDDVVKTSKERGRLENEYTCKTPLPSWYTAKLDAPGRTRCGRMVNACVAGDEEHVKQQLVKEKAIESRRGGYGTVPQVLVSKHGKNDFHTLFLRDSYTNSNDWGPEHFIKWQVAIYPEEPFTKKWNCDQATGKCRDPRPAWCGGTIIDTKTVITAAHCIQRAEHAKNITVFVVAGQHDLTSLSSSKQIKPVKEFIIPKGWRAMSKDGIWYPSDEPTDPLNDMAILKLESPLEYTDHVGRACLPEKEDKFDVGTTCFASGWGAANNQDDHKSSSTHQPMKLRFGATEITDPKYCEPDGHCDTICVGKPDQDQCTGGTGHCKGDSGGPLICEKNDNGIRKAVLVGTVQGGRACGGAGIFSSVIPRLAMIRSAMETADSQKAEEGKEEEILEKFKNAASGAAKVENTSTAAADTSRRRAKTIQFSNAIRFGTIFALGGV